MPAVPPMHVLVYAIYFKMTDNHAHSYIWKNFQVRGLTTKVLVSKLSRYMVVYKNVILNFGKQILVG